jgi:DnaJ-class molecular chaperone
VQRQVMMMGPIQMVNEGPCGQCTGSGKIPSGACYVCSGNKTIKQEKTLDVRIEPGMRAGEVLVFNNECSDDPNFDEPGDVHFVLQEAAGDEKWVRKGDDLATDVSVCLRESLLGCTKVLQGHPGFPDGLPVEIPAGVVNLEVVPVSGKGMPKREGGFGNLQLTVRVQIRQSEKAALQNNQPLLEAIFPKEE